MWAWSSGQGRAVGSEKVMTPYIQRERHTTAHIYVHMYTYTYMSVSIHTCAYIGLDMNTHMCGF